MIIRHLDGDISLGGVGLTPCSSTEGEKEKWEEEKEMLAQLGNSLRVLVDDFQWLP